MLNMAGFCSKGPWLQRGPGIEQQQNGKGGKDYKGVKNGKGYGKGYGKNRDGKGWSPY